MYRLSLLASQNLFWSRLIVTLLSVLLILLGIIAGVLFPVENSSIWFEFFIGGVFLFFVGYLFRALLYQHQAAPGRFIRDRLLLAYFYNAVFLVTMGAGIQMGSTPLEPEFIPSADGLAIAVNQAPKKHNSPKATFTLGEKISQFLAPVKRLKNVRKAKGKGLKIALFLATLLLGGIVLYLLAVLACAALCSELALLALLAGLIAPLGALYGMGVLFTSIFRMKPPSRGKNRLIAMAGYVLLLLSLVGIASTGVVGLILFGLGAIGIIYGMIRFGLKNGESEESVQDMS